jgi:signal transduction histidine kinase
MMANPSIGCDGQDFSLTISDNGAGFDAVSAADEA